MKKHNFKVKADYLARKSEIFLFLLFESMRETSCSTAAIKACYAKHTGMSFKAAGREGYWVKHTSAAVLDDFRGKQACICITKTRKTVLYLPVNIAKVISAQTINSCKPSIPHVIPMELNYRDGQLISFPFIFYIEISISHSINLSSNGEKLANLEHQNNAG